MIDRQENIDDLASKYESPRTPAVRELVRRTLGTELANGYTTVEQADELGAFLALDDADWLLDLGSGRGWPGIRLAAGRGCRLVSSDLTVAATMAARPHLQVSELSPRAFLVAASGIHLPFRAASFNAVVHADVLC